MTGLYPFRSIINHLKEEEHLLNLLNGLKLPETERNILIRFGMQRGAVEVRELTVC